MIARHSIADEAKARESATLSAHFRKADGMVIRRIGVWSLARIYGVISATIGLLIGLFLALFSLAGAGLANDPDGPAWLMPIFGVGAIVVLPLFYGVMGVVSGAISAAIYNLFAGMVGGISIEVE
jgi:hypothetical protein